MVMATLSTPRAAVSVVFGISVATERATGESRGERQ